ncbi:Uma2 family endonuclease [Streptomyces sp. SID13666]|uniref:Uma2 family endonuclease n=1 Tax=unclassified Streptomyces TaxID=2593676 RepID=UPI0013BF8A7C|nr:MULTISPECIES: Uma2 family endonuclease [unclassified Streptomyces]NEA58884.1 Uma2 family endonuclease [Streptomyces sp. SID13666]NEA72944.1 Uma2 family endonuclease [Streptomyces sp. SID13588]
MSALNVEPESHSGYGWDDLVRIWEETDVPEGCTVEIIEGIVTVAPPRANDHNNIADDLQRELYRVIPRDWGIFQTQGLAVPSRKGLFIPDLAVVPKAALQRPGHFIAASEARLIAEITSPSNPGHDRISKPAAYACAGVPLYLLIDSWAPGGPTVTLFSEPEGDVYRSHHAVKFGDPIELPAPFGITLATGSFPVG